MADTSWQGDVSVFALDIVGYSNRSNADQLDIKSTTEDCLERAGTKAEQIRQREWTSWADAGDGGYLLMGGDPRKALEVLEEFSEVCPSTASNCVTLSTTVRSSASTTGLPAARSTIVPGCSTA